MNIFNNFKIKVNGIDDINMLGRLDVNILRSLKEVIGSEVRESAQKGVISRSSSTYNLENTGAIRTSPVRCARFHAYGGRSGPGRCVWRPYFLSGTKVDVRLGIS